MKIIQLIKHKFRKVDQNVKSINNMSSVLSLKFYK